MCRSLSWWLQKSLSMPTSIIKTNAAPDHWWCDGSWRPTQKFKIGINFTKSVRDEVWKGGGGIQALLPLPSAICFVVESLSEEEAGGKLEFSKWQCISYLGRADKRHVYTQCLGANTYESRQFLILLTVHRSLKNRCSWWRVQCWFLLLFWMIISNSFPSIKCDQPPLFQM